MGRIGVWSGVFDAHPMSAVQDACVEIEAMGYSTVWLPEAVGRDPFVVAGACLAATSTLRLATGIANIYARDPMTTVACQRTLAEAYPGRFMLGLGVSHHHLVERLRKHDYSKPLAYMQEYLKAMDEAMFVAVGPDEDPGRVIAALGPKMLKTAATQCTGAHPYLTTPEHTLRAREVMGEGALLAPEQMVVVETDPEKARSVGRKSLAIYLRAPNYQRNLLTLGFDESDWADPNNASDRLVDGLIAWGTPEQIKVRVDAHLAAGADHVCIQTLRDDTTMPLDEWRAMAEVLN
ncbi:MAG: TIGR03620 family F420-dependent LLM class oxidoreductase [Actinobacteria bacterium]|nr:TIGR03620 family F420-dependent LLM class oxidoreductase [Actinomycetota bacterium]